MGTAIERQIFKCVRTFYETSVAKIIFNNNTIEQLTFLDPRNRDKTWYYSVGKPVYVFFS